MMIHRLPGLRRVASTQRFIAYMQKLLQSALVAAHGPPVGTQDAALLSSKAMENFQSVHGERFCTALWTPGTTSRTVSNLVRKKWNWNC